MSTHSNYYRKISEIDKSSSLEHEFDCFSFRTKIMNIQEIGAWEVEQNNLINTVAVTQNIN
jgi:hypothetical protein